MDQTRSLFVIPNDGNRSGRQFADAAFLDGVPASSVFLKCRNWGLMTRRATDVAEEASAEAYRRSLAEDFNNADHYRAWITRTAINVAIDILRAGSRSWPLGEFDRAQVSGTETGFADRVLEAALATLPEDDRVIVSMTFEQGLTLDEIAEQISALADGSPNAKRLRIKRRRDAALRQLRVYLEEHGVGAEVD